jgi:hypothetical protein
MAEVIGLTASCLALAQTSRSLYKYIKRHKNAPNTARRIRKSAGRHYRDLMELAADLGKWSWLKADDPRLQRIYDAIQDATEFFNQVMRMTYRILGETSVRVSPSPNRLLSMWEPVRMAQAKIKEMVGRIKLAQSLPEANEMVAGIKEAKEDVMHAQTSLNA